MGTFGHLIFKYHHEVGCSSELCLELLLSSRRGFEGRHYKNNQQSILLYQLLSRILSRLWKYLPRLLQCRLQKPWLSWLQSIQSPQCSIQTSSTFGSRETNSSPCSSS